MNLKKEDVTNKTRYCMQYDDHSRMMCSVLCSLMEHQSLVDLAIRCGNNTIHAHKCVLAANSPYFREQLETVPAVEQIVINGLDFAVVKSIVEFMYCGETNVVDDNFKYVAAASKVFQIRGIQVLAGSLYDTDVNIEIPPPLFLTKKPKYSSTYLSVGNLCGAGEKSPHDPPSHRRPKRKYMRTEAERACAKEAAASRLALEALQKELASTDQMSSFVIEESCTETTVENFIPNTNDEAFVDNFDHLADVPLQVVNYTDLNACPKPIMTNAVLQYDGVPETATEKLKQILGGDIPPHVEIMFKTSDGNFVSLTEEVLQNITKESLQYQVIDEHGRAGEVQQLSMKGAAAEGNDVDDFDEDPIAKYVNRMDDIAEHLYGEEKFEAGETELKMGSDDQTILEAAIESDRRENALRRNLTMGDFSQGCPAEDDPLAFEVPTRNLHRSKLDSLKKRSGGRRSRERQFCDEFLDASAELSRGVKSIYDGNLGSSGDIRCIEIMEPSADDEPPPGAGEPPSKIEEKMAAKKAKTNYGNSTFYVSSDGDSDVEFCSPEPEKKSDDSADKHRRTIGRKRNK